ncbi:MAG TPA: ThiF family adenylyltransferase [Streptosporangiaceae bacterium]|nr:ThiF family adenylyltransferase [Streptosporangiaceae bacterium]
METRPRIKLIYDTLYLDGRIRVGSGFAAAFEIEDETGRYGRLMRLLDGTRTVPELAQALAGRFEPDEVPATLATLRENGLLEDAAEAPPPELTERDVERYAPNLNFFRFMAAPGESCYAPQARLKQTRVTILGIGGIGSNLCLALAELGVGYIRAVDFDHVELSNLNRQVLYSTSAIGLPKAEVAAQRMKEFNPDIEFVAEQRRMTSLADVMSVVGNSAPDFLFCLADKPQGYIDHWVNEACVRNRVPFAAASISSPIGTAYSVLPGNGPCFQCRSDSELAGDPRLAEELDYIREYELNGKNGALGPACMMLAYFLSYELLRHRLGLCPMLTESKLLEINFVTFAQQWHEFTRRTDCAICG